MVRGTTENTVFNIKTVGLVNTSTGINKWTGKSIYGSTGMMARAQDVLCQNTRSKGIFLVICVGGRNKNRFKPGSTFNVNSEGSAVVSSYTALKAVDHKSFHLPAFEEVTGHIYLRFVEIQSEIQNIIGRRFGKLVCLRSSIKKVKGYEKVRSYLCRCDCGNEVLVAGSPLNYGTIKSCGCLRARAEKLDTVREVKAAVVEKPTAHSEPVEKYVQRSQQFQVSLIIDVHSDDSVLYPEDVKDFVEQSLSLTKETKCKVISTIQSSGPLSPNLVQF